MKLMKEQAGVISKNSCWILWEGDHMYSADTLLKLLFMVVKYWKDDRFIIG